MLHRIATEIENHCKYVDDSVAQEILHKLYKVDPALAGQYLEKLYEICIREKAIDSFLGIQLGIMLSHDKNFPPAYVEAVDPKLKKNIKKISSYQLRYISSYYSRQGDWKKADFWLGKVTDEDERKHAEIKKGIYHSGVDFLAAHLEDRETRFSLSELFEQLSPLLIKHPEWTEKVYLREVEDLEKHLGENNEIYVFLRFISEHPELGCSDEIIGKISGLELATGHKMSLVPALIALGRMEHAQSVYEEAFAAYCEESNAGKASYSDILIAIKHLGKEIRYKPEHEAAYLQIIGKYSSWTKFEYIESLLDIPELREKVIEKIFAGKPESGNGILFAQKGMIDHANRVFEALKENRDVILEEICRHSGFDKAVLAPSLERMSGKGTKADTLIAAANHYASTDRKFALQCLRSAEEIFMDMHQYHQERYHLRIARWQLAHGSEEDFEKSFSMTKDSTDRISLLCEFTGSFQAAN